MKPNNQFKVRQIVGITMLKYVIGFMDSKVIVTYHHLLLSTPNHDERKSEVVMSDCLEKQV